MPVPHRHEFHNNSAQANVSVLALSLPFFFFEFTTFCTAGVLARGLPHSYQHRLGTFLAKVRTWGKGRKSGPHLLRKAQEKGKAARVKCKSPPHM